MLIREGGTCASEVVPAPLPWITAGVHHTSSGTDRSRQLYLLPPLSPPPVDSEACVSPAAAGGEDLLTGGPVPHLVLVEECCVVSTAVGATGGLDDEDGLPGPVALEEWAIAPVASVPARESLAWFEKRTRASARRRRR